MDIKRIGPHPQEQAKLRSELLNASVEERYNLKALQNVIKEGLRLNPVAALGGIRTTSKDIILEETDKYPHTVIPKGSMMFFSLMSILQNPFYFENPDDFIPSRWDNPSDDAVTVYLPFLTGPRNCVGQSLAYAEMRTVLSHLCSTYEFTIENEGTNTFFLTYKPRNCLLVANRISVQ
jgi:cytochrome P450